MPTTATSTREPGPGRRGPSPTATRLIGLVLDLAVVAAATGGVAVLWLGSGLGGLLMLLACGLVSLQLLRSRVAARAADLAWEPLRNVVTGPRALLAVAVAAGFALTAGETDQSSAAALAVFVGLGCLAAEPVLSRAVRYTVPVAAHLPGTTDPVAERDLAPAVVAAGVLASAVGAVLLAADVSAWWWLPVELVAVIPAGLVMVSTVRRVLAGRRQLPAARAALARYAPDFLVFTGRPDDASYQLVMWLDYFRRTGLRFAFVTRSHLPARALAARVPEPVVEVREAEDLSRIAPPSARAAFYVNASGNNGLLVADRRLRHIYIGHGDSDKPPSFNPTHAQYDEIFTAGPAAARRYPAHGVSIAPDKFRTVGRPQVEDVQPARGPIAERERPVVLYAPTWRGHVMESRLSSLPVGERIVSALLARDVTVVFRSHPLSRAIPDDAAIIARIGQLLAADAARTGRPHRWGPPAETEVGILDCLNDSDAMVADVSSVVSDYLFSTKPFAMIAVPALPPDFLVEYPVARAAYVVRGDLADLDRRLDAMLGPDPMAEQRAAVRADYLGDFAAENYAEAFVEAVREVCRLGPVVPAATAAAALSPADGPVPGSVCEPASEPAARAGPDGPDGPADPDTPAHPDDLGDRAGPAAQPDDPEPGDPEPGDPEPGDPDLPDDAEPDDPDQDDSPEPAPRARSRSSAAARRRAASGAAVLQLAGTLMAAAALVLALLAAPAWLVALVVALATAELLLYSTASPRHPGQWPRLLGYAEPARVALLAAGPLIAARAESGVAVWLVAVALALAALAGESLVRRGWAGGLQARRLPGADERIRPGLPRGVLPMLGFGHALLAALLAIGWRRDWFDLAGWLVLAAGVMLAAVAGMVVQRALRRADEIDHEKETLQHALQAHGAEFVVYSASPDRAQDIFGPWVRLLDRLGRPWLIVVRSRTMLDQVERLCRTAGVDVPVVYRRYQREVEDVVVPPLRAAMYLDDYPGNTHLVERRDLTQLRLNLVRPTCHPEHAIYDVVLTPAGLDTERYAAGGILLPADEVRIVPDPTAADAPAEQVDAFLEQLRGLVGARPVA